MVGHLKTVSILAGGYLIFKDSLNLKQLFGILLTVFGLLFYTFAKLRELPKLASQQDKVQYNLCMRSQMGTQDIPKAGN